MEKGQERYVRVKINLGLNLICLDLKICTLPVPLKVFAQEAG